jgi:7-cyano-7-deazaguanine reductase
MPNARNKKKIPEKSLTLLGNPTMGFPESPAASTLETFPNRFPQRDYTISFDCEDFTSLCPVTGQPDFARIHIEYVADEQCIETKSLKFYLSSYRNTKSFNEEVVNQILEDFVAACAPRHALVHGEFASRGGIRLTVVAEHRQEPWEDQEIPF